MKKIIICMLSFAVLAAGCNDEIGKPGVPSMAVVIDTDVVVQDSYIGNGAQWDPYELNYGAYQPEKISDADWQKIYARLDYMKFAFTRVCVNAADMTDDGTTLNPEKGLDNITPILDYCQSRNVSVLLGDWGRDMVDASAKTVNENVIRLGAEYLKFLVETKGYTCIKYYQIINEPNGDWSTAGGDFSLWQRAVETLYVQMKNIDIHEKVIIAGPDAAVWKTDLTSWVADCVTKLNEQVGIYELHTYPSKVTVNSGDYSKILKAYVQEVPPGRDILMGELAFKYTEDADVWYAEENERRIDGSWFASKIDSQMFVYEYMYGTDMADALIQMVNAGFAGCAAWLLDDAIHNAESLGRLKIWGFWNILGNEHFGVEEEIVRPWYYAWSLLTRYMPAGCRVYQTRTEGGRVVKGVTVEKDGKYMVAVVNPVKEPRSFTLKSATLKQLTGLKQFIYSDGTLIKEGDMELKPNHENVTLNLEAGEELTLGGETLVVYTNFDY